MISFVALLAMSSISTAATPPPATPIDPHPWQKALLKEKPTHGISMGSLFVQFEKTTLDDVRRAASLGEISHQGDAGESIYWLCYTSLRSSPVERIWVIAHGEIGGSAHSVTSISAQIVPNGKATTDCPALPANLMPLSLDNNLWLNSAESDALKKFGSPSYQEKTWRSYYFNDKKLDSGSWLWLQTEGGRVTSLLAGQVTGY
jgi:hypothetical protein